MPGAAANTATRVLSLALSLVACSTVSQAQVFRSIDSQGNVTYSATSAPEGARVVEEVPLAPPPTEEQRQAAEQRARAVERELERIQQQRETAIGEQDSAVAAAQKALGEARAALERAKVRTVDDWQTLATGGRVPSQRYLERVARAEERLRAAEEALRRARSGR